MTQCMHTLLLMAHIHFQTVHSMFTSSCHFDIVHSNFGTVHTLFTCYDSLFNDDTVHTHFDIVHTQFTQCSHTITQFTPL